MSAVIRCTTLAALTLAVSLLPAVAQEQDPGRLTIDRVFNSNEFAIEPVGPIHWSSRLPAYTTTAPSELIKGGQDIVAVHHESGMRKVLVSAAQLTPRGEKAPLEIEDFAWSVNESRLLIYTNSKRVWRQNTRGDYWVFDVGARELRRLGGDAPPSTLMFARFSPQGDRVAYVRDRDIYLEDLTTNRIERLTKAESPHIINGTFDWVYEEEFDLRDGIRWSPDGKAIAFWQLDTSGVDDYFLLDNTSGLYQQLTKFKYPKSGRLNSSCRAGVIDLGKVRPDGASVSWLDTPGDPRDHYIARMDWSADSEAVVLQQLNRLQNTNRVILFGKPDRKPVTALVEQDKAWVDVCDHLHWIDGGKLFTWLSERDGWRRAYAVSRDGRQIKPITPAGQDVIDVALVDDKGGWLYYYASPENATQKHLYRVRLEGGEPKRLSPADQKGTHHYELSPDGQWAVHTFSTFNKPPVTKMVHMHEHRARWTLAENGKLRAALQALKLRPAEFFRVRLPGSDLELDGWCIKPLDFDKTKRYPMLFHVYGEPAGQTVLDRWSPSNLWHQLLAQQGYLVVRGCSKWEQVFSMTPLWRLVKHHDFQLLRRWLHARKPTFGTASKCR